MFVRLMADVGDSGFEEAVQNPYDSGYCSPLSSAVSLARFSVICGQLWSENHRVENSRNPQFMDFNLCAIVRSVMKSHTV